jgi:hypothetical protein
MGDCATVKNSDLTDEVAHGLGQSSGRLGPPPLRIHHLMLATTVAAVLLSVNELLRRSDVLGISQFITSGYGALYTIVTALAATMVMLGIYWRVIGRGFFDQPGHWLIVKQALGVGFYVAVAAAAAMRLFDPNATGTLPISTYMFFTTIATLVISVWATFKVADSTAWRLWFVFYGIQMLLWAFIGLLGPEAMWIMRVTSSGFLALLIIAAVGDRLRGRVRDWPHWLGVAMQFVMLVSAAIQTLLNGGRM